MNPLIINPEEDKKEATVNLKEVDKNLENKKTIPNNYIEIKLESNGILSAPKKLHFRDYSMDDALELNVINEEDQLEAIVRVLNNMIWEKDFDCKNLHPKELAQIIYTLHGIFINSKIEKEYYYDENLPEGREIGQKDYQDNIGTIEIPVSSIKTINIMDGDKEKPKFKEPFSLFDDTAKLKFKFRLLRINDLLYAKTYCDTKYEKELKEYAPYKRRILKLKDIKNIEERNKALDNLIEENYDIFSNYQNFITNYENDYAKVIQASTIIAIGDKECTSIEEKLEIYKNQIGQTLWPSYNKVIANYDFGIDEKVTFFSEKLQKNVTRGFQFQFTDFLPDSNKDYSARYHLSFD
jgi:hypothetical protein